MQEGAFTLDDLSEQLKQMAKIGGMKGVLGMLPGIGKAKDAMAAAGIDDRVFKRQQAIISSMTKQERSRPDVIDGKRRKRIARGSGVDVAEVNKLLKMHRQMADMMKEMKKKKGGLGALFGLGGGGMPDLGALQNMGRWAAPAAAICRPVSPCLRRASGGSDRTVQEGGPMALKIRLARGGTKKRPHYSIVIADSKSPRDGRFIEKIGFYDPMLPGDHAMRLKLDVEKAKAWMAKGAQPTDRVHKFLANAGAVKAIVRQNPQKAQPKAKAQERAKAAAEAAAG